MSAMKSTDEVSFTIDHVALSVPNLEVAEQFYVGALGLLVKERKSWGPGDVRMDLIFGLDGTAGQKLLLTDGSFQLEIWQFNAPLEPQQDRKAPVSRRGISHFGLRVRDIATLCEKLAAAGMTFHGTPSKGPTGTLAIYGRDPFGNVIELVQPPSAG